MKNQLKQPIIIKEISYDMLTPVQVYSVVGGVGCCMLESVYDEGYGTYSFIGINPIGTFTARGKNVKVKFDDETYSLEGEPYQLLSEFALDRQAFGFVSYDAVRLKEDIPQRHHDALVPDFLFHIYKTIIKFDHKIQQLIFFHEGEEVELNQIIEKILMPTRMRSFTKGINLDIEVDISDEKFCEMVNQAQEYIKNGDIFQVVLSRTFSVKNNATPFDIYRALRKISPTPYMTFFQEQEFAIAGASPELLVGVKGKILETVPIAGTCKIGDNLDELIHNEKENAEHIMLVDLARNDLGMVSEVGSVKVTQLKSIKTYSHVHHIVSRVEGSLSAKYNPLDVLKSVLPAGTLSGAPKIRAMEIIDELETSQRGLYGGALMMIDKSGDIVSAIAIRNTLIDGNKAYIRTGAGIVLDSIPQKEADETKLKARGVIAALELANGEIL